MHKFLLTGPDDRFFSLTEFVGYADATGNRGDKYYIDKSRSRQNAVDLAGVGRAMLVDLPRHVDGPASPDDPATSDDLMTNDAVSEALS